jgi:phage terminase large subunit-like protein
VPAFLLGPDGFPVGLPEDHGLGTLAWGVLEWGHANLAQPDGEAAGVAWDWTNLQIRFMAWWYAVDPSGAFLFDRAQLVLPKGSGKSPFAGALGCCALGAPVVFDGWNSDGGAVGRPAASPHVQLAAVSEDQTENTMSIVLAMLREGDAIDSIPGLDLGLTRIFTANGKLEPVTASAPSREGQRLTDAILDEPHLWLPSNGGVRMAAVLRRNLAKMKGRSIETTNTWRAGEDSVAEATSRYADLAAAGKSRTTRILRMHPTATVPDLRDEDRLRAALTELYTDMPWIGPMGVERFIAEIYDPNTDPSDARRFYLNEVTSADDALVTASEWDACGSPSPLAAGDIVTLGFDGGKTDDATALVACRLEDRLFSPLDLGDGAISIWERPQNVRDWSIDRELVDEAVERAFTTFDVVGFYADVALWESYVDVWSAKHRKSLRTKASTVSAVGWDMRSRLQIATRATERLVAGIRHGQVRHSGDKTLRRHVLNARRRPNRYGISFGKESRESQQKVDGFAAAQLADMARHDLMESGWKPRSSGSGRVIVLN